MGIKLGWTPIAITPTFSYGQDWIAGLEPKPNTTFTTWPVGMTAVAKIYPPTLDVRLPFEDWPTPQYEWDGAVDVDTNVLGFKAESAETDLVLAESFMFIWVSMPNTPSSDDYMYMAGKTARYDGPE